MALLKKFEPNPQPGASMNLIKLVFASVVLTLVLNPFHVFADEGANRKLAEDLLLIMKIDEQQTKMFDQIKQMQKEQMLAAGQSMNVKVPEESIAVQGKIMDLMSQEMTWDKVKEDYISAYADTFSEEDLHGLIEFYKSPVGQKLIDKSPELTKKMMAIGQAQTLKLLPKIKEITASVVADVKEKKTPAAAPSVVTNSEVK